MKTLQELYKEIIASEELKTAFVEAAKAGKTVEFLKAQGCEATTEELAVFLKSQTGKLSDEELDNVAGGKCSGQSVDILVSIRGWGVACAIVATVSAIAGETGSTRKDQSALCHE
ncbi:MAG: hypothetical protein IJS41_10235 [Clostridia bacterium]|nr:hypothetical protein [Clostridia bacterium]